MKSNSNIGGMRAKVVVGMTLALLLLGGGMAGRVLAQHEAPKEATTQAGEVKKAEGGEEAKKKEEHKGSVLDVELGTPIFTLAIFIVLLLILRKTAWNPILTGLKAREESIRSSLERADRAKAEADQTAKELEAKINEVQRQGAAALAQAKLDAAKLSENIMAQAEAEATGLKERAMRDIEAAKQQAIGEINGHAAELATAVARKILQRNITVEDQNRLVEESLEQMGKNN